MKVALFSLLVCVSSSLVESASQPEDFILAYPSFISPSSQQRSVDVEATRDFTIQFKSMLFRSIYKQHQRDSSSAASLYQGSNFWVDALTRLLRRQESQDKHNVAPAASVGLSEGESRIRMLPFFCKPAVCSADRKVSLQIAVLDVQGGDGLSFGIDDKGIDGWTGFGVNYLLTEQTLAFGNSVHVDVELDEHDRLVVEIPVRYTPTTTSSEAIEDTLWFSDMHLQTDRDGAVPFIWLAVALETASGRILTFVPMTILQLDPKIQEIQVISDLDDTIRRSDSLLPASQKMYRSFFETHDLVTGMSHFFAKLSTDAHNNMIRVSYHVVTASVWNFMDSLVNEFMLRHRGEGLPWFSMTCRDDLRLNMQGLMKYRSKGNSQAEQSLQFEPFPFEDADLDDFDGTTAVVDLSQTEAEEPVQQVAEKKGGLLACIFNFTKRCINAICQTVSSAFQKCKSLLSKSYKKSSTVSYSQPTNVVRQRDDVMRRQWKVTSRFTYKTRAISKLLNNLNSKESTAWNRMILVGDSGAQDADVYAWIVYHLGWFHDANSDRKRRGSVQCVLIRHLLHSDEKRAAGSKNQLVKRIKALYGGFGAEWLERVRIFENGHDLLDVDLTGEGDRCHSEESLVEWRRLLKEADDK